MEEPQVVDVVVEESTVEVMTEEPVVEVVAEEPVAEVVAEEPVVEVVTEEEPQVVEVVCSIEYDEKKEVEAVEIESTTDKKINSRFGVGRFLGGRKYF